MCTIPRWGDRRRRRFVAKGLRTGDALTARRFHIIALLSAGLLPAEVARQLHCAKSTVSEVRARFLADGEDGLHDGRAHNGATKADEAFDTEVKKVLRKSPPDFGYRRPTWTRELLARVLAERGLLKVSVTTIGRVLARLGARRGRPKPFVKCPWPSARREQRLAELRALAERCRAAEPVFHVDEVDIHFNPKIGPDWMLRGQQRWVLTPGKNRRPLDLCHRHRGRDHAHPGRRVR